MGIINEFRDTLQEEWTEDPSEYQREAPVPQPTMFVESQIEPRAFDLAQGDMLIIRDGGIPIVEPAGVGYNEERIEVLIDVDLRTARGRGRLTGEDPNVGTYDGLAGEVQRITRRHRHGIGGFDILYQESFDDQTSDYEAGIWGGMWSFRLIKFASIIQEDSIRGPS